MQGTPTSRKSGSNAPHRPNNHSGAARAFALRGAATRMPASALLVRQQTRDHARARAHSGKHMIVLFTDFGLHGPYTGQMKAVLHRMAPGIPTIDLFADAPAGNPKASAYLLAAYAEWFAAGTTFLCVVDPGVGGTRPPVIVVADGRWYVGHGNGLFELDRRRAAKPSRLRVDYMPTRQYA